MFEARSQEVQAWLIKLPGADVNLENIEPSSHKPVVTLERMRQGLHRIVGYRLVTALANEE